MPGPDALVRAVDRRALADAATLFIPAIPFGFVVGLAIVDGEMPVAVGWSTSIVMFAGAAQLAVLTLAGTATLWAIIVAGIVINARHVMYSAAMAPTFQRQPRWMRWLGPMLLIDQTFALSSLQTGRPPAEFRRYYLTAGLFIYVAWNVATVLGMLIGPVIPTSWRLDAAPPIMFMGLVVIGATSRPAVAAAVVGGGVSLVAAGLPDRLGILIGGVAGVAAGATVDRRRTRDGER